MTFDFCVMVGDGVLCSLKERRRTIEILIPTYVSRNRVSDWCEVRRSTPKNGYGKLPTTILLTHAYPNDRSEATEAKEVNV